MQKKDKDEYSVLPFSLPLSNRENKKYLEKCIKAIAMTNYIQTRHKYCISSFSDSKKVKMSMKFFHFLCHYLLEGEKNKVFGKMH